ncbi:Trans-aconitate methyltransferase [Selenomonas sp. WCT3]|uniref:class I SAM-dependent methyltransferase n=1 Tax=Selenomonas sp. WCT3 TaxID=3158785 RepID=UPI0008800F47|nr:Trans-aconitate methyltransferase [Selenomonas ruminantium]
MNLNWNAKDYGNGFSFVHEYGEDVMSLITAPKGSQVVDLGCGNGALTAKLAQAGFKVLGIDASAAMLEEARKNHPELSFKEADALSFHLEEPADVIFSNAVFHWIDEDKQYLMLRNIAANLRTGGQLVTEFGGIGCGAKVHGMLAKKFAEYGYSYQPIQFFPSIGEYTPLVDQAGLRVDYAILFDRPTPQPEGRSVADWIRMFIQQPFDGMAEEMKARIIRETEEALAPELCQDGIWTIDYVRIRLRAVKIEN